MRLACVLLCAAAAHAACSAPALDTCVIPPLACHVWPLTCAPHDYVAVDLTVANGAAEVYLLPGGSTTCGGGELFGLCGYPNAIYRCRETRECPLVGGVTLVILSTNVLESIAVDGSIRVGPADEGSYSFGVVILIAIVLGAACFIGAACVICWFRRPSSAHHYVQQVDVPQGLEMRPLPSS
ncbi:MAG TPA: hypothetical protein VNI01_16710 [Elusimicrobiota bacterium]|nr:hypothetical protein [Elusimicrobiota bacterium]